jgi:tetratricopeptide (TPR) repeat protein
MRLWSLLALWTSVNARAEAPLFVAVPEPLRHMAIALPPEVRDALGARDWSRAAAGMSAAPSVALVVEDHDQAFVQAWALMQAGRAGEAGPLLDRIDDVSTAPLAYRSLLRATILRELGQVEAAFVELARVPTESGLAGRAAAERATGLAAAGRLADAQAAVLPAIQASDPVDGLAPALAVAARLAAAGSAEQIALWRRIWVYYPTSPEAAEATAGLVSAGSVATATERVQCAERLMDLGRNDEALATVAPVASLATSTADGCRVAFVRGRALYKKNVLSEAVAAFQDAGRACGVTPGDYGARVLYLVGFAEFRRGRMQESASAYRAIAELYPESTMADDGLSRGGLHVLSRARSRFHPRADDALSAPWPVAAARAALPLGGAHLLG